MPNAEMVKLTRDPGEVEDLIVFCREMYQRYNLSWEAKIVAEGTNEENYPMIILTQEIDEDGTAVIVGIGLGIENPEELINELMEDEEDDEWGWTS